MATGSFTALLFLVVTALFLVTVAGVTVTVGDGTPASCTDTALDEGFAKLRNNGDMLDFNCGDELHTIALNSPKWTAKSVTIDGGDKITLHGQDQHRHFIFSELDTLRGLFATDMDVTVKHIKLVHGFGNAISTGRRTAKGVSMKRPVPKHDGGSIYMGKRGTLRLSHVTITDSKSWGEPILRDAVDERNYVTFRGGGVYIGVESSGIFEDCVFEKNVARMEGGAVHASWQTVELTIRRSMFYRNEAFDEGKNKGGGAIFVQETFFACEYCYFRENHAQTGGAISHVMAETTLRHCIFSKNAADKNTKFMTNLRKPIKGGALYMNGARKATGEHSSIILLSNCTFEENNAEKGGGVYLCLNERDSGIVEDSRFCGNWLDNTESYVFPTGAALQRDCRGTFTLRNTHMGGNMVIGRDFRLTPSETFNDGPENVVFKNNSVPGWPDPDRVVVDPPGPTCAVRFCDSFPEYCVEAANELEEASAEIKTYCVGEAWVWSAWSECTIPCGGCGTQRRQKSCKERPIGVVYQYRVCNVCPCRSGTDPELLTVRYSSSAGSSLEHSLDTPCCFKFQDSSMVHQLSEIKACNAPLVNGWYDGTYDRDTYCESGAENVGLGPEYIGL